MLQICLQKPLTRRVEPFVPEREGEVRMYSCGPTVYRPSHVGNLRSYLLADWLRRTFELFGWRVTQVKNITDVGHMRQDAVDRGEDKVIAAALAEGKTPQQIAEFYEDAFHRDEAALGILPATVNPRATAHVPEMIAMIEQLATRGLAYEVDGTVYYPVKKFSRYGALSGNVREALRQGVRAEVDPNKRDPADFALWKRAEPGRRALTWDSPWGPGYPGWHIECSAMSTKYLGETFDLHTGGVDNIFPHHEDEIAQSEGALGHPVVGMWVHGQHLLADGMKMAKSARNTIEIDEIRALGLDPLAFRYMAMLTHYRRRMNFSVAALRQAAEGLDGLRQRIRHLAQLPEGPVTFSAERHAWWLEQFKEHLADDLDLPGALAFVWYALGVDEASPRDRLTFALAADRVLGLDLESVARERDDAPVAVAAKLERHLDARRAHDYASADALRVVEGWQMEDHASLRTLLAVGARRLGHRRRHAIASAGELPDLRAERPSTSWSLCILSREWPDDLERAVRGALLFAPEDAELLVLDQGSSEETKERIDRLSGARVRIIHSDRDLGEGHGRNALLRVARGRLLLQLDPSVEIAGDLFVTLETALRSRDVGVAGPWGLRTKDLKHFDEVTEGDCDAIQGYCLATRRETLLEIGGFDERYRFYRNLDIAVSCAIRERGVRAVAVGERLARRHAHRQWDALSEDERLKRSRKNYDRMYHRFHGIRVTA